MKSNQFSIKTKNLRQIDRQNTKTTIFMNLSSRKRSKASFKWKILPAKKIHSLERNTSTTLRLAVTSSVACLKTTICFLWLNSKTQGLASHLHTLTEPAITTNPARNTSLDSSLSQRNRRRNVCRTIYLSVVWISLWNKARLKIKQKKSKRKLNSDQLLNWRQTRRNRDKFNPRRSLRTWCQCLSW